MTIDKVHDFIRFLEDKEANYHSHEEIDACLDRAQQSLFKDKLPTYGIDQQSQDDLNPFKVEQVFTNASTPAGLITMPADTYEKFLGAWVQGYDNARSSITYQEIEMVNDDDLPDRLSSQLDP